MTTSLVSRGVRAIRAYRDQTLTKKVISNDASGRLRSGRMASGRESATRQPTPR